MKLQIFLSVILFLFTLSCNSNDSNEQQDEYAQLELMYNEIAQMAEGTPCTDASEWSWTAIGEKACGGPMAYIAYSNSIDTELFLQKVEAYTQAQHQYNMRWSIVSDCSFVEAPSSVDCVDGQAVLNY